MAIAFAFILGMIFGGIFALYGVLTENKKYRYRTTLETMEEFKQKQVWSFYSVSQLADWCYSKLKGEKE
jgi:hypothetical protein